MKVKDAQFHGDPATMPTILTALINGPTRRKLNVPSAKMYGTPSKLPNNEKLRELIAIKTF